MTSGSAGVMFFLGTEGSGKTLSMTYFALNHGMEIASMYGMSYEEYCIRHEPVIYCLEGYDMHSATSFAGMGLPLEKLNKDGKLKLSQEIKLEDWYANEFDEKYANCIVCIDEVQNFFSKYSQASNYWQYFMQLLMQRRRRNFVVLGTIQGAHLISNALQFAIHNLVICRDVWWSSWGKENLERGEQFGLGIYDCKGFMNGDEYQRIGNKRISGKKIWPFYDSFGYVSIFAGNKQIRTKKERVTIDPRGVTSPEQIGLPPILQDPDPESDWWANIANKITLQEMDQILNYSNRGVGQAKLREIRAKQKDD
ncbi:MAG: hypothetical protein FWH42_04205 [Dehalococcoidia bacterium]|nr:hypothetical protein [Dehalococcoidia bacterium]